ncbi:MAG TPA: hypothetical protein VK923_01895, partial [Euzebyales bacterium]|nr:hypothetical protein [Euzebyales bacterium]
AAAFAALAAAFVGMVRRYRASTAGTRRQYRWVLAAIAFLVVALLIGLAGSLLAGVDGVWWMPILLAYVALPVAFMVAILRYRLYEIDRLISRTVTYSVVVTLAGAAYLGAIAVLTLVLPRTSDLAVAASTLAAAAVVRPLHRRVHAAIDRRFNRPRFDAEREIRRFGRGLRDQTDLAIVEASLSDVVARTVHPASYVLWIRPP